MALVKKYSFVDRQTNVPVVDISSITGSDILNSIDNELKDFPLALKDFESSFKDQMALDDIMDSIESMMSGLGGGTSDAASAMQSLLNPAPFPMSKISGAVCDAVNAIPNMLGSIAGAALGAVSRSARSSLGPVMDVASAGASALENFIGGLLPGGVSSSLIRSLSKRCKDRLGSYGSAGSPWGRGCGHGSACGPTGMTGLLNSLSGNKFGQVANNINGAVTGIVGLASLAYDSKLCGAFGTLVASSPFLEKAHIARAGAGVLSNVAARGNIKAVADISKSVQGMNVLSIVPDTVDKLMGSIPKMAERTIKATAQSGLAGLDLLDDTWNKSKTKSTIYAYNEKASSSKGATNMYRADAIAGASRNIDSFSNSSKYSELAYSLGKASSSASKKFSAFI